MTTSEVAVAPSASAGSGSRRIPIAYLAPWVDVGGADTGTIDWFTWIDRRRFAPLLLTTQPSANRRLGAVVDYADEVWSLPDLMSGDDMCVTILDVVRSRGVRVVHLMNSRIGFELLPDLRRLPDPPVTVVQLHVEEPDRCGYTRYVCTRYGNLVDAFAVSSRHLAAAVADYGIPSSRIHVVPTGVDAHNRFHPQKVQPVALNDGDAFHVLWCGRLAPQKDPGLMIEVADGLRRLGLPIRVHVLGDGELEPAVRAEVARRQLADVVRLHGPVADVRGWYAACDALLMTSVFEGVPYVLYEAMAMAVPAVVPALPGNVELLEGTGMVVERRDDVDAYVSALALLAGDVEFRHRVGAAERRRILDGRLTVGDMARSFGALYASLLEAAPPRSVPGTVPEVCRLPPPLSLEPRPAYDRPLVSVVVPCHDHGRYLEECIASLTRQTYPHLEIVVVDDGSTDAQTLAALEGIAHLARVIRLGENRGPSAARNAGIAVARGRYVLPVDADNLLLPDAVERLVAQLQSSGESVGFIYPNQQFFGNRADYHEAPPFNAHTLLQQNYCDTCSLLDRRALDAGVVFAEDIRFGHEDWDLALQMVEREIYGEPANGPTLLSRKAGFTRSDLVEHGSEGAAFAIEVRRRHPALAAGEVQLKARWSPALSLLELVPLRGADERVRVRHLLAAQSCGDAEVVLRDVDTWDDYVGHPGVRRVHPDHDATTWRALETLVTVARGRWLCAVGGAATAVLGDRAGIEKLVRCLAGDDVAVALVAAPCGPPLAAASASGVVVGVAWPAALNEVLGDIAVGEAGIFESLAAAVARHVPLLRLGVDVAPTSPPAAGGGRVHLRHPAQDAAEWRERTGRLATPPILPGLEEEAAPEWKRRRDWRPPLSRPLYRHRHLVTGRRVVTHAPGHGPGWVVERDLGSIRIHPLAGTRLLVAAPGPSYRLDDGVEPGPGETLLGFVEVAAPFPLLDELHLARHRRTDELVLVAGDDDPLLGEVDRCGLLGFIEPHPIRPRRPRYCQLEDALRALDATAAQLEAAQQRAAVAEARLERIFRSFPGRAYRRLRALPGIGTAVGRLRGG